MTSLVDRWSAAGMNNYGKPQLALVRGEGAVVTDEDGKQYVDFLGGIAVNALGHAHPAVIAAVTQQLSTLGHVSNIYVAEPPVALAELLLALAGRPGRVLFCNSGAEANEAAFKLSRLTGRTHVVATDGAFHGRTMGALALTGQPSKTDPFRPLPGDVTHVPFGDLAALDAAVTTATAMVILEPIQGENGVVVPPAGYLAGAREICTRNGALFVLDEIQTGIGRTGRWFSYEYAGILPDAVTIAKGMAGGVPIGSLVTFGWASDLFQRGMHGSTFGGNPLATAAANAVLGEIEDRDLVGNAERRGVQLRERIAALRSPLIGEIRGQGLLIGLGLTEPIALTLAAAAMDAGLIINAANESSIRMAPPLIIRDLEIDAFITRFTAALAAVGYPAAPAEAEAEAEAQAEAEAEAEAQAEAAAAAVADPVADPIEPSQEQPR